MFSIINSYAVTLDGCSVNIYELMDDNTKRVAYAMDNYNGKMGERRIKILDYNPDGEEVVYSETRISKTRFLELKCMALEQLKDKYMRQFHDRCNLIHSIIKTLIQEKDNNISIKKLKELLKID